MPKRVVRRSDGTVPCILIWELPGAAPGAGTPRQCGELPFLSPVSDGHARTNAARGNNCEMLQLPVLDAGAGLPPAGAGWYYDDFSQELQRRCKAAVRRGRVAFSVGAEPPSAVRVVLDCLEDTQVLPNTRADLSQRVPQPGIGTVCHGTLGSSEPSGDNACILTLADGTFVRDMFCHADTGTCVQRCRSNADCPPGWGCDDRPESIVSGGNQAAYCINLACG